MGAALYIDLSPGLVVEDLFAEYTSEKFIEADIHARTPTLGEIGAVQETFLLKDVCSHTHEDIMRLNERSGQDNDKTMKKVILALKMGVSLIAFGLPPTDAEQKVHQLCADMGVRNPDLDFAERALTARLVQATYIVRCSRSVDFDKLSSCVELLDLLHATQGFGDSEEMLDAAIWVLDDIQKHHLPYGWLIQLFNMESLNCCAAIAAYGGNWEDVRAVALVAPLAILTQAACKKWGFYLGRLELNLVGITTGLMCAVVYRLTYELGTSRCRITIWYLATLITYLPGGTTVYGIYEAMHASVVNGAAKVVGAVLTAMGLAVCLNIGECDHGNRSLRRTQVGSSPVGTRSHTRLVPQPVCGLSSQVRRPPT